MNRARALLAAASGALILGTWLGQPDNRQPALHLGRDVGDCEALSNGFLAQPINTLSSLALVVAGLVMFDGSRKARSVLGVATVFAGTGSALLHGTAWDVASTFDALGVAILIAAVVGLSIERSIFNPAFPGAAGAVLVPAVAFTLLDGPDMLWLAVALSLGMIYEVIRHPSLNLISAAVIGGLGLLAWYLGQTGVTTCDPNSVFQYHAVWHVAAAGSLLALGSHYERS